MMVKKNVKLELDSSKDKESENQDKIIENAARLADYKLKQLDDSVDNYEKFEQEIHENIQAIKSGKMTREFKRKSQIVSLGKGTDLLKRQKYDRLTSKHDDYSKVDFLKIGKSPRVDQDFKFNIAEDSG